MAAEPIFLNVNQLNVDVAVRPGSAFANGTEWEAWQSGWCARCVREPTCPLIDTVLIVSDYTPEAWVSAMEGALGPKRYVCMDFRLDAG